MTPIWSFSLSSKEELEKCIAAAQPPDATNKWILRFGLKNQFKNNLTSNTLNREKPVINNNKELEDDCVVEKKDLNLEHFEEFTELIQNEPISRFEMLVAESLRNHKILTHLANRLCFSATEKLINHIYENKDIDAKFIEDFHKYFIPCLLRKEHSWFTLDMLIKSHRLYSKSFETLFITIIKDIKISKKVLQDLIENLNEKQLSELLTILLDLELSSEEFSHNVYSLYMAYKGCKKNIEMQQWILTHITRHALVCENDKSYGRLLLAFLQTEKELQSVKNYETLEKVLEMHRSPFKRPCMNLLREILEKYNEMDENVVNSEII